MPRVVGGDEVALAPALDEGPALQGLEVVVVAAEMVQELEQGDVALGPVDAVVDLQVGEGGTALDVTPRRQPLEGGALMGGGRPAEMGHAEHLGAPGGGRRPERGDACDQ